jgi:hypothetical protein
MADVAIQNITVDDTPAGTWRVLYVDDATGTPLARLINGSSLLSAVGGAALTGATFTGDVALPATAPGVNGATRVSAVDAATGRFAVNGVELGDTGWRRITSWDAAGVVTGEPLNASAFAPAIGQAGFVDIRRRQGEVLIRVARLSKTAAAQAQIWAEPYRLPVGFRPDASFAFGATVLFAGLAGTTIAPMVTGTANRLDLWTAATASPIGNSAVPVVMSLGEAAAAWATALPGTAAPGSSPFVPS